MTEANPQAHVIQMIVSALEANADVHDSMAKQIDNLHQRNVLLESRVQQLEEKLINHGLWAE